MHLKNIRLRRLRIIKWYKLYNALKKFENMPLKNDKKNI